MHVIPRTPRDFASNDDVYKRLAEHDHGPDVVWREIREMEEECRSIRDTIVRLFLLD